MRGNMSRLLILFFLLMTCFIGIASAKELVHQKILKIPEGLPIQISKEIIKSSLGEMSWRIVDDSKWKEGQLDIVYNIRSHKLYMSLNLSKNHATFEYVDSVNLNYKEKKESVISTEAMTYG